MNARSFALMGGMLVLLSACGFSPVYAPKDNGPLVAESLGDVEIASIPNRQGQMLRNHLIDRIYTQGRPSDPKARLEVAIRSSETDLGILKDSTSSRRQYNMWADYSLNGKDGKLLAKGTAHSVVSFSKMDAQYGTLMTEKDAQERATKEVGEQIVNRISLYYAETARAAQPMPAATP